MTRPAVEDCARIMSERVGIKVERTHSEEDEEPAKNELARLERGMGANARKVVPLADTVREPRAVMIFQRDAVVA